MLLLPLDEFSMLNTLLWLNLPKGHHAQSWTALPKLPVRLRQPNLLLPPRQVNSLH